MKRIPLIPALALIALIIPFCEKKESRNPADTFFGENESGGQYAFAGGWGDGYVLRMDSAFYSLVDDTDSESDRTRYDSALSLGEKVSVGKIRRATYHADGVVYDFVEIRRNDGSEGLGWASQVAKGGSLAVVVDENASLFRSPRAIDVSTAILSRTTVVVLYPETERDGFVQIRAYDPVTHAYVRTGNNYIRLASLSQRETDIETFISLQTARE